MTQQKETPQHALYSPSKLPRIILCPASGNFESQEDRAASNRYADEGTTLHSATSESLDLSEYTISNETITKFSLDKVQQDAVQECLDYVFALRTKYQEAKEFSEYIERKVTLSGFISTTSCEELHEVAGTLDYALVADRVLHITDWKFGVGIEVFPDSEQLKAYALGTISSPSNLHNFDSIVLTIVQPRLANTEELVKSITITPQELHDWLEVSLVPALIKVKARHPVFSPSEKACRWCPIKHTCKARREMNMQIALDVFRVHDLLPQPPLEDLLDLLGKADILRSYLKDLEQHVFRQLTRGIPVDGYKIVAGRSNRAWKDPLIAKQWCIEQGLDEMAITKVELLGPAKVEKLLKPKARQDISFTSLVIKPDGKPTLTSATDKREAIGYRTVEQVFSDVDMPEEI